MQGDRWEHQRPGRPSHTLHSRSLCPHTGSRPMQSLEASSDWLIFAAVHREILRLLPRSDVEVADVCRCEGAPP